MIERWRVVRLLRLRRTDIRPWGLKRKANTYAAESRCYPLKFAAA